MTDEEKEYYISELIGKLSFAAKKKTPLEKMLKNIDIIHSELYLREYLDIISDRICKKLRGKL